jgi:hypothetical protein
LPKNLDLMQDYPAQVGVRWRSLSLANQDKPKAGQVLGANLIRFRRLRTSFFSLRTAKLASVCEARLGVASTSGLRLENLAAEVYRTERQLKV